MSLNATSIYPATNPKFISFPSRRSVVHSTKGIVSSTQPLASQAGAQILREGGNAADAAVAVAAVLNVTEPGSTGIGGDMFCLFFDAKTKKIHGLNGSGRSGSKITLAGIRQDLGMVDGQGGKIPMTSIHAVTVPGAAAGWVDCVDNFGSGKLSLEQILRPATELAEDGFPVSELSSSFWQAGEQLLRTASPNGIEVLKKDINAPNGCRAPSAGEIMRKPTLAATFRLLAKHGRKGFYEGSVAEAIVKVVNDLGGHLTIEDLKSHGETGSELTDPISLKFNAYGVGDINKECATLENNKGVELWEHQPNGQGIVALMALGLLQEFEKSGKVRSFSEQDHNTPEYLHALIEALRIAFADANWWVADPAISKVPSSALTSSAYLAQRAQLFNPERASTDVDHGSPASSHSDTVYFCVTDSHGNGISFINSVFGGFGSGIVPQGCGFTLQNRGAGFALHPPDHPNILAPSKRPYHTIIPALITNQKDDSLHSVYGVMGGYMQPQGHVQVLMNMLVFKLSPQAALDAPRICIGPGMPGQMSGSDRIVYLEEGISEEVARSLTELGHEVTIVKGYQRGLFGRGQVIRCHFDDNQMVYSAGSDPRGDGAAIPM